MKSRLEWMRGTYSLYKSNMKQTSVIITLGIIHIIILSLFGMYFYRLKHTAEPLAPVRDGKVEIQEIQ